MLIPAGEYGGRRDWIRMADGTNGEFDFTAIAPGEYRVFAWELPVSDPNPAYAIQKEWNSWGATAIVRSGERSNVTVELTSASEIWRKLTAAP